MAIDMGAARARTKEEASEAAGEHQAKSNGAAGSGPQPFPFTLLRDVAIELESKFVIRDVVPYQGLGEIYAPPGGGKTAVAVDMGLHIADGREYRRRRTERQPVVYIALEGHGGINNRVAAARRNLGLDGADIPFALIKVRADFRVKETSQRVAATVNALVAEYGGNNPVIYVDTFQSALGAGGNDCNPEHVTALIENIKSSLIDVGCTVIVVHHTGKDAAKGSRGWSGLLGALDFELEIDRKKDARFMYVSKQRDTTDEQPAFCYRLHAFELGRNQYDEPVTAVIVEHLADAGGTAKGNKLTPTAQAALNVLWNLIKSPDQSWPLHGCPGMKCTMVGVWKKACIAPGAISNCKNERDRAIKFKNAMEELIEQEKIVCDGKEGERVYPRPANWEDDAEVPEGCDDRDE